MATKRIETQLTIKAVDEYSGMLRNMRAVTGRFADGVRTEMSSLQRMRGPLRIIEDFRKQQDAVRRSGVAMEEAREKQRRLLAEIRATRNPTAQLRREFDRARATADRLEQQHHQNRRALHGLQVKLREAGVNTGNLTGEQRRLAAALDGATAAFGGQMERMRRLELMQNRISGARARMDRSLATAANMSFVGHASMQSGRRVLTMLSDVSGRAGDLQEQFTEFQNLTGIDDTRLVQLREDLDGLRDVTKTSVSEMLDGLAVLVGKGMDFEDALAALPAAGRAAKATKTSFDEMGASGFALYDNLKVAPEELAKAFDIMAMGGKEGGFELSAMARKFPEITAGARAVKMEGLDSVAQLTAALQIAMKAAGSEDQAATNLSNFLGKITSPETVRRFAKMGVSIEAELRKAAENGVSPFEHMLTVINDLTGGDALKMGELFGDKQVLDFLRAMIPNLEEYRRIKEAALSADGVVDADFERVLAGYNESKAQLGESFSKLLSLPPEVLESFTSLFQKADAIVERLIVWKKENPKLVKTLFVGATALGSMAVAGGALLTTAAGLVGTMAVLRFALVGLGARAAFAAGDLMKVSGGLTDINRMRVGPSIPNFSRHKSAFRGFRSVAAGEMLGLAADVGTGSASINKSLASIKWKSFFASALMFNAVRNIPETQEDRARLQEENVRKMDSVFRKLPGLKNLIGGYEWAFEKLHGAPPPTINDQFSDGTGYGPPRRAISPRVPTLLSPMRSQRPVGREDYANAQAAATALDAVKDAPLPTPAYLEELRDQAASLREEIGNIQGEIDNLGQGPMADAMALPLLQTMDARRRELQEVEADLATAETRADDLTSALKVLDGTEAAPEISTESIDRANRKVARLLSQLRAVPSVGTRVTATPRPVGARAGGGPVRLGLPYLVNENTPRSELFVPSRSGGILNVGQAQAALRSHLSVVAPGPIRRNPELARLHRGVQGIRAASLAMLTGSALAAPAPAAAQGGSGGVPRGNVRVEINGGVNIQVPSGVSDPEAIAELVSDRIGQRVAATLSASFSD